MSDGKKKSKKGVTMNLTDFLSDGNSVGNWGDDIELPTGPQSDSRSYDRDNVFGSNSRYDNNDRYDKYDKYGGNNNNNNDHYGGYERNNDRYGNNNRYGNNDRYGGNRSNDRYDRYNGGRSQNHDMYGQDQRRHYQNDRYGGNNRNDNRERFDRYDNREREQRQRQSRPIPENPPYTAYFGNLPEDTTEESLRSIIAPFKVKSIRLITHEDGRLKGFGYVEFEDRADLESVIRGPEILYKNRTLRVDVAEQKEKPEKPSDNSNWRARTENKNTFSVFGNRNTNNNNRQESNWRARNNDNSQGRKPFGSHRTDEPLSSPTPAPAAPPKKKVNPFGEAKPVDTAEIERKVEEKMIKADEEILKKDKENEEKKENAEGEEKKETDAPAPAPAPVQRERPMSQQKTRSSYYNNRSSRQPAEENSWRRSTNSAPAFKSTGVFQRNNSNQRRYNNQQPRNNYNQMKKEEDNRNVVEIKNTYQVLQDE